MSRERASSNLASPSSCVFSLVAAVDHASHMVHAHYKRPSAPRRLGSEGSSSQAAGSFCVSSAAAGTWINSRPRRVPPESAPTDPAAVSPPSPPCCLPTLRFVLRSWGASCVFLPGCRGCGQGCKADKQVDLWSQPQQAAEGHKWNFGGGEDAGDARLRRLPPDAASLPGELHFHTGDKQSGLYNFVASTKRRRKE